MQKLQLKGFESVFRLLHLLPSYDCHIHSGVVKVAKTMLIVMYIAMPCLQIPYNENASEN